MITVGKMALQLALGRPVKVGMQANHGCDNPPCCNPSPGHLYEGTPAQNHADMALRGRGRNQYGPWGAAA